MGCTLCRIEETSTGKNHNWDPANRILPHAPTMMASQGLCVINSFYNWDNGAIGNYKIDYNGKIFISPDGTPIWKGDVVFYDEFDLDPHWDWSRTNPRGRSEDGERRTRIGYMLNLGTDFDIIGPKAEAAQLSSASMLVFTGKVIAPARVKPTKGMQRTAQ